MLIRIAALVYGILAAGGVLAARKALVVATDKIQGDDPVATVVEVSPPPSRTVRNVRLLVGAFGVVVMLVGIWKLLHNVLPQNYWAFLVFLLGAIVLHDAIIAPVTNLLRFVSARTSRLPPAALGVLKGGFVVGGVITLVVLPAIYAKHLGPLNPTILPGSYGIPLVATLAVIVVLSVVGAGMAVARSRRRPATTTT